MKKRARVSEKTGKPGHTWFTGSYAPVDRNNAKLGILLRSKFVLKITLTKSGDFLLLEKYRIYWNKHQASNKRPA